MTSECPKPVALLGQGVGWVFTETGGKEAGHNLKRTTWPRDTTKNS